MAAASGALAAGHSMKSTSTTNMDPPWLLGPITASWKNAVQIARCFQTSPL